MNQWRDIKSAPLEENLLLARRIHGSIYAKAIGYWNELSFQWEILDLSGEQIEFPNPTHWMPEPESPPTKTEN